MKCSECGSMNFEDVGYEDGGGDYGDGFTEVYKCCDCGAVNYGDGIDAYGDEETALYGEQISIIAPKPIDDDEQAAWKKHQPPSALPAIPWLDDVGDIPF